MQEVSEEEEEEEEEEEPKKKCALRAVASKCIAAVHCSFCD